ncbi:hypothetical protein BCD67_13145 [Oscillatoriales cyanobacterium USR001]|nr:hypothetical protein BCD67_13145 [Oscillatoriales cyanobacterium USR001]
MRISKRVFLSSLFSIGLVFSLLLNLQWFSSRNAIAISPQSQTSEFRGFWVDAFNPGFKTPQEVTKLVADAKRANANAIVAQVRRRGDAFYQSSIEPRSNDPNLLPSFDPLQDLITKGHAAGLEIHAWMVTLPVTGSTSNEPSHVWQKHGPNAPGRDNWAMFTYDGEAKGYLDPGHPDAVDYTVSVYLDVIKHYDVDGIQLDYVRYGGPDWGYNPTAVARFNQQMKRTGIPEPNDPVWMQWRRDQVTNLVRKIYVQSLAIKPHVKISAATIAWGNGPKKDEDWYKTQPYKEVLQDWRSWLEEGILDIAMPMTYQREYNPQQKESYDNWIEFAKNHQYDRYVAIGPGNYLNYIEDTLAQIRRAQKPSAKGNYSHGITLYSYASSNVYTNGELRSQGAENLPRQPWNYVLQSNDWFYNALAKPSKYVDVATGKTYQTEPVWENPVSVPDLPWKSHPTKGAIAGTLRICSPTCDAIALTLEPVDAVGQRRTIRTDGKGWFGAINLTPGTYQLKVDGGKLEQTINISAGQVTNVNFAGS